MEAVRYKTSTDSVTVSATSGGASGNVLYTCPAIHTATIDMLMITNGNTTSQKITVEFYDANGTSYHNLIKEKIVAANTALNVLDAARMHLHSGDKIVVSKDGGTFDATISVREFYNPNR